MVQIRKPTPGKLRCCRDKQHFDIFWLLLKPGSNAGAQLTIDVIEHGQIFHSSTILGFRVQGSGFQIFVPFVPFVLFVLFVVLLNLMAVDTGIWHDWRRNVVEHRSSPQPAENVEVKEVHSTQDNGDCPNL